MNNSLRIVFLHPMGMTLRAEEVEFTKLGGSETVLRQAAEKLAERGHDVTVYANTNGEDFTYEDVLYRDHADYYKDKSNYDIAFYQRTLQPAAVHVLNVKVAYWWLHDVPTRDWPMEEGCLWAVDKLLCLSDFQKDLYVNTQKFLEPHIRRTTNGIDLELCKRTRHAINKDPNTLIYTSRPERGLPQAFSIYHKMAWENPNLRFGVASYVDKADLERAGLTQAWNQIESVASSTEQVKIFGQLDKRELYKQIAGASILFYPCNFPEISCITAMEAMALGTPVVAPKAYALQETLPEGYPGLVDLEAGETYEDKIKELLEDPDEAISAGLNYVEEKYGWDTVIDQWENFFEEDLTEKGYDISNLPDDRRQETVACCMIVKNEEDFITGCLKAVAPWVDEIHILDTGSTDATVQIIKDWHDRQSIKSDYPAPKLILKEKTYEEFSFDQARNDSVEGVETDWILWIDADERFTVHWRYNFRDYLRSRIHNGAVIRQWQFSIDESEEKRDKPGVDKQNPTRLYKNYAHCKPPAIWKKKEGDWDQPKFLGRIHEHVYQGLNSPIAPQLLLGEVNLGHFGYLDEPTRRKKAIKRNLELLVKDRKDHPERQLTITLMIRDRVQMCAWALENSQDNPEQYLQAAIGLYTEHFRDKIDSTETDAEGIDLIAVQEAFIWYQKALKMAHERHLNLGFTPFWVNVNLAFGAQGQEVIDPNQTEERWFVDTKEFKEYMTRITERLVARVSG